MLWYWANAGELHYCVVQGMAASPAAAPGTLTAPCGGLSAFGGGVIPHPGTAFCL